MGLDTARRAFLNKFLSMYEQDLFLQEVFNGKYNPRRESMSEYVQRLKNQADFLEEPASALCQEPTVTVAQGTLRGQSVTSSYGLTYNSYLGIPYAQPPVGNLRFKAPQDPVAWEGTRDATTFGSSCVQDSVTGSEDCLYLNVYTPQNPSSSANLPVMVYIHGGAFVSGSGSDTNNKPEYFLEQGIIVVYINYRLNIFGFLSLEGTDVSGNAGLKDQVAALRWVKNNIASFGGDPNSVTIVGESAGGASIHYQVLSPMSQGLFQRAISESGSALNPWAFHKNTQPYAFNLGNKLGLNTIDAQELATFLRSQPATNLINNLGGLVSQDESAHVLYLPFVPATEYPISGEETFLPSDPYTLVTSGNFNKVPYITGANLLEGKSFVGTDDEMNQATYWEYISNDIERLVPLELGLTKGSQQSQEVANKIKQFYFGDQAISVSSKDQYINLMTDELIVCGIHETLKAQSASDANIYNYYFTFNNPVHGGEMYYLYYSGQTFTPGNVYYNVHIWMVNLWSSFIKTGTVSYYPFGLYAYGVLISFMVLGTRKACPESWRWICDMEPSLAFKPLLSSN
uniref:Carboxylic ester hydrolase n=1 Tax=Timema cristinae TaxID=61476 RepID=A0A7R9CAS7_TIMCR|nr:unnamed protein product [Timema cristinae]